MRNRNSYFVGIRNRNSYFVGMRNRNSYFAVMRNRAARRTELWTYPWERPVTACPPPPPSASSRWVAISSTRTEKPPGGAPLVAVGLLRKNQCWGSVAFWCGSGSADPYFWLMDPDPDPTADTIPFFSDHRNITGTFSLNFMLKFWVNIFCEHYFSRSTHLWERKGKEPDPYLLLMDPDPGVPKTCGSGSYRCSHSGFKPKTRPSKKNRVAARLKVAVIPDFILKLGQAKKTGLQQAFTREYRYIRYMFFWLLWV